MLKWRAYSAAGGRAILWISIWLFNGVGVNIPVPVGISHNNYGMGRLDYLFPTALSCVDVLNFHDCSFVSDCINQIGII